MSTLKLEQIASETSEANAPARKKIEENETLAARIRGIEAELHQLRERVAELAEPSEPARTTNARD